MTEMERKGVYIPSSPPTTILRGLGSAAAAAAMLFVVEKRGSETLILELQNNRTLQMSWQEQERQDFEKLRGVQDGYI